MVEFKVGGYVEVVSLEETDSAHGVVDESMFIGQFGEITSVDDTSCYVRPIGSNTKREYNYAKTDLRLSLSKRKIIPGDWVRVECDSYFLNHVSDQPCNREYPVRKGEILLVTHLVTLDVWAYKDGSSYVEEVEVLHVKTEDGKTVISPLKVSLIDSKITPEFDGELEEVFSFDQIEEGDQVLLHEYKNWYELYDSFHSDKQGSVCTVEGPVCEDSYSTIIIGSDGVHFWAPLKGLFKVISFGKKIDNYVITPEYITLILSEGVIQVRDREDYYQTVGELLIQSKFQEVLDLLKNEGIIEP